MTLWRYVNGRPRPFVGPVAPTSLKSSIVCRCGHQAASAYLVQSGPNRTAYCASCGSYVKNVGASQIVIERKVSVPKVPAHPFFYVVVASRREGFGIITAVVGTEEIGRVHPLAEGLRAKGYSVRHDPAEAGKPTGVSR